MWRNSSVLCRLPSKAVSAFPWGDSSSPRIKFGCGGRGPGKDPLDDGEGGVGGRGGEGPCGDGGEGDRFGIWNFLRMVAGPVPNRSCVGNLQASVLLTDGGDVMSTGGRGLGSGFGVIAGDNMGSSFIGVIGLVFTNFCLYGDSVGQGSVSSGVGSARNMCRCRSSLQYQSNGVDRHGSSSLFISAAGSTRTVS